MDNKAIILQIVRLLSGADAGQLRWIYGFLRGYFAKL